MAGSTGPGSGTVRSPPAAVILGALGVRAGDRLLLVGRMGWIDTAWGRWRRAQPPVREPHPTDTLRDVLVNLLVAAGVLLFPVPVLVLGVRGLRKRPGYSQDEPADRASYILLIALRGLVLLTVFALSAVVLVSTIGATVVDVPLHGMVYVFFGLDVLLAVLVILSFGRPARRPARRRATPAAR